MRDAADAPPCAARPARCRGRAGSVRRAAPAHARRLRQLALCGLAQPEASSAAAECNLLSRSAVGAAAGRQPRPAALAVPPHGRAARALSGMLCDELQAAPCRATVRLLALNRPRTNALLAKLECI